MSGSAVYRVKQVRAHGAGRLPLRAIHEAVQDERGVATEEPRHFDLLGHAVLADSLEDVVLRHLAPGRQGAALRSDGLDLPSQCHLLGKQRVSRFSILGALVGIGKVRHAASMFTRLNWRATSGCL